MHQRLNVGVTAIVSMRDALSFVGAAYWGYTRWIGSSATYPFAQLSADRDSITVSVQLLCIKIGEWRIPKAHVRSVHRFRVYIMSGVRIEHSMKGIPSFIVFYGRTSAVLEALKALDYNAVI